MTNMRTLKAKTPGDLLAVVPYVLGFHPEDSLVMLTLGDAGDKFHARVDLPRDDADFSEVIENLTDAATRNGVRRVAIVAYSDDQCASMDLVERLEGALEDGGVNVVEAIRCDGERWFSLSDCTEPCCPDGGTPYDVGSHPFTAQSVLDGQVTLRSREALSDSLVGNDPNAIEAVEESAGRAMDRFKAASRHPLGPAAPEVAQAHLVQEGHWVGDRVRRFLADGVALDADDAGRMLVAIVAIDIRDVAWAEMDRVTATRHVDLWRDLVRRSPYDLIAPPAALLGFSAWLSGDGALAWCAVDRCQETEPDYRLAGLLTTALLGAVPPSAWSPVDRSDLTLFAS